MEDRRPLARLLTVLLVAMTMSCDAPADLPFDPLGPDGTVAALAERGDQMAPIAPTSLAASVQSLGQIDLTWDDGSNNETGFEVSRQERTTGGSFNGWSLINTTAPNATMFNDLGASGGRDYRYRVRACIADGCSGWARTPLLSTPANAPDAPSAVTGVPFSSSQVDLAWDDVDGESHYSLERKYKEDTGTWTEWSTLAGPSVEATAGLNASGYSDLGVTGGRSYRYRIQACNDAGCSAYVVSTVVTPPEAVPPTRPASLTGTPLSLTEIILSWPDAAFETGYVLQRKDLVGGTWTEYTTIATPGVDETGFSDTGLTGGRTYRYRIRGCNAHGCGSHRPSPEVSTPEPEPRPNGPGRLSVGDSHVCALDLAGKAYCWGNNTWGGLGDGTEIRRDRPVAVHGGHRFERIAASPVGHTCALKSTGRVLCWGFNGDWQVEGAYSQYRFRSPIEVALPEPVLDVDVGERFTCALTGSGRALCWGRNWRGQLGTGATSPREGPTYSDHDLRFSQLSVGTHHACALDAEGRAFCWGGNDRGQLGDGTESDSPSARAVQTEIRFRDISATDRMTCGVSTDGGVYCWGESYYIGFASRTPLLFAGTAQLTSVVTGRDHACGLDSVGRAHCLGREELLGKGTATESEGLAPVVGGHRFEELAAGYGTTCGRDSQERLFCWGLGSVLLGRGESAILPYPVEVTGNHTFRDISAGRNHTCAADSGGAAVCWGFRYGLEPVQVGGALGLTRVFAGQNHDCALDDSGKAYCWGDNQHGSLGTGESGHASIPTSVLTDERFVSLTLAFMTTCGLTAEGKVFCWGYNGAQQFGQVKPFSSNVPILAASDSTLSAIALSSSNACGLNIEGTILCWGAGIGIVPESIDIDTSFQTMVGTTCGLDAVGDVWCWDRRSSSIERRSKGFGFVEADGGHPFCGRDASGTVYCWYSAPDRVHLSPGARRVTVGGEHRCALSSEGRAYCWGFNRYGQVGVPLPTDALAPRQVLPFPVR